MQSRSRTDRFRQPAPSRAWRRLAGALVLWLPLALPLALPLVAAGCSGSNWSQSDNEQAGTIEDPDYPNLSRVPGEQPRPTPSDLRKELIEGLAADHANARYSGELLTGASAAPPPAPPPPAAQPQVEIIWDTLRVEPDGGPETGDDPEAAPDGDPDEVQINWQPEGVDPIDRLAVTGRRTVKEEPLPSPAPRPVGVVYFDRDSALVESGNEDLLKRLVALYKEESGHLRLVGHSGAQTEIEDQVAQRIASLDLSLQRANAVAASLLDLGAETDQLTVEAKAGGEAAAGLLSVGNDARRRRVEIFLEH
jgi:outer membrane protein OmpA-like peptidoglycan-associated protein